MEFFYYRSIFCWKISLYIVSLDNQLWGKRYQRHQVPYGNQSVHLSKVLDLHDTYLSPGQVDPMDANYGLSPVFGLSSQIVPTRLADDVRPMLHVNDRVGNMYPMLVVLIVKRNLSFSMTGKYFLLHSIIFF